MHAIRKTIFVAVTIAALLTACAPGLSTDQVQSLVQTSVAMTMQAQNQIGTAVALTVAAQAQSQATATATPTEIPLAPASLTPVLPTPTTFAVAPPSGGGGGGGGGGSSVKPEQLSCDEPVSQVPQDNSRATILKVGDTLDVKWTLLNRGTKTWPAYWPFVLVGYSVDSNNPANAGLTTSSVTFTPNLGFDVKPGKTITLSIQLTAPGSFEGNTPIHITTQWAIDGDGSKFCKPFISIEVIRPGMTP